MNCKPGDLAAVVRPDTHGFGAEMIGAIRRVTKISDSSPNPDRPCWKYVGERLHIEYKGVVREVAAIPDYMLQPIRGEGVDQETEQREELKA